MITKVQELATVPATVPPLEWERHGDVNRRWTASTPYGEYQVVVRQHYVALFTPNGTEFTYYESARTAQEEAFKMHAQIVAGVIASLSPCPPPDRNVILDAMHNVAHYMAELPDGFELLDAVRHDKNGRRIQVTVKRGAVESTG